MLSLFVFSIQSPVGTTAVRFSGNVMPAHLGSTSATEMNRITRYVVGELFGVFSIAVCVMTGLMVMLFLVQEALRENLTLDTIVELVPYTIPTALSFSIPGTILFAVCIVYGLSLIHI